jgi:copper chaperone CopZ
MDEERHELMMQVDGLKGPGCGETIREALRPVDPDVDVSVDLAHGRVRVVTRA